MLFSTLGRAGDIVGRVVHYMLHYVLRVHECGAWTHALNGHTTETTIPTRRWHRCGGSTSRPTLQAQFHVLWYASPSGFPCGETDVGRSGRKGGMQKKGGPPKQQFKSLSQTTCSHHPPPPCLRYAKVQGRGLRAGRLQGTIRSPQSPGVPHSPVPHPPGEAHWARPRTASATAGGP